MVLELNFSNLQKRVFVCMVHLLIIYGLIGIVWYNVSQTRANQVDFFYLLNPFCSLKSANISTTTTTKILLNIFLSVLITSLFFGCMLIFFTTWKTTEIWICLSKNVNFPSNRFLYYALFPLHFFKYLIKKQIKSFIFCSVKEKLIQILFLG